MWVPRIQPYQASWPPWHPYEYPPIQTRYLDLPRFGQPAINSRKRVNKRDGRQKTCTLVLCKYTLWNHMPYVKAKQKVIYTPQFWLDASPVSYRQIDSKWNHLLDQWCFAELCGLDMIWKETEIRPLERLWLFFQPRNQVNTSKLHTNYPRPRSLLCANCSHFISNCYSFTKMFRYAVYIEKGLIFMLIWGQSGVNSTTVNMLLYQLPHDEGSSKEETLIILLKKKQNQEKKMVTLQKKI